MIDTDRILDGVLAGLRVRAVELDAEQSPIGIDLLDEVALHPALAGGLVAAGLGVHREVHYPGRVASRPRRNERDRCDLVIHDEPGRSLLDPVSELMAQDRAAGTLFEPLAPSIAAPIGAGGVPLEPEEVAWAEVKCVRQFLAGGEPNAAYARQLVDGPAGDIARLALEPRIEHACAIVTLACRDEPTGAHDLVAMAHALLDRGLPADVPSIGGVPIADRVGHAWFAVAVVGVRL